MEYENINIDPILYFERVGELALFIKEYMAWKYKEENTDAYCEDMAEDIAMNELQIEAQLEKEEAKQLIR